MRIPASIVCLTISLAFPVAGSTQSTIYTRRSLRAAMQSAHTAKDYAMLAEYFHQRETWYTEQSALQARALDQALAHPGASSKYPAADASARRFHEYYAEQAVHARALSDTYARKERELREPHAGLNARK